MHHDYTVSGPNPARGYAISGIGTLRLESIPAELKGRDHWVAWKAVEKEEGKKPTKIPVDPHNGGNAKSNDPTTWGSFEAAVKRATTDNLAGIGLMFADDDLVGVDLDNVLNPDGTWANPLAEAMVRSLDSYTEVSPSGRGVKVWLTANDKPTRTTGTIRHTEGGVTDEIEYETYFRGRWFAVTGHAMPYGDGRVQERSTKYAKMLEMGHPPRHVKPATSMNGALPAVLPPADSDIQRDEDLVRGALRWWNSEDENRWFRAGCCLKCWGAQPGVGDQRARALWDAWSMTAPGKFAPDAQQDRWDRIVPDGGLSIGTLFSEAEEDGWNFGDAIAPDGHEYHAVPPGMEWTTNLDAMHADWQLEYTAVLGIVKAVEKRLTPRHDAKDFPAIVSASSIAEEPDDEPPQIIHGVLHQGAKAVYGGPSKAFKSWTLIDLCIAVATGADWLGFDTTQGRVLYINLELQPFAVRKRLQAVAGDRLVAVPEGLDIWNLRGHACPMDIITDEVCRRIADGGYSLICPDPIYKVLGGMDENSAGDIASICNAIERMACKTGAAVVWGAHFAKGNASAKESIDRISGSGVWARDPDAIITATAHEHENAFTVDMTLRNFAQPAPFVVRWNYPRMTRDDILNPEALKKPKGGREAMHKVEDITEHLGKGMVTSEWQIKCREETGMASSTFYSLLKMANRDGLVTKGIEGIYRLTTKGAKRTDWSIHSDNSDNSDN